MTTDGRHIWGCAAECRREGSILRRGRESHDPRPRPRLVRPGLTGLGWTLFSLMQVPVHRPMAGRPCSSSFPFLRWAPRPLACFLRPLHSMPQSTAPHRTPLQPGQGPNSTQHMHAGDHPAARFLLRAGVVAELNTNAQAGAVSHAQLS